MKESKGYALTSFGQYAESLGTLRASGGDRGGGSEMLIVDTLVFDKAQITSKFNYSAPTWGGQCHPLTSAAGEAIVIIKVTDDDLSERDGDS